MKILCILPDWKPTYSNKNVGKLFSNFEKRQIDFILYCSKNSDKKDFLNRYKRGTIFNYRPGSKAISFLSWMKSLVIFLKVLIKFNPTYVLWTYAGYRETFFLSILKLFGGPNFTIKMDSLNFNSKTFYQKIRTFLLIQIPFNLCSKILCETNDVMSRVKLYNNKTILFPNGIPKKELLKYINGYKKIRNPVLSPYFLFTGRIMHLKGLHLLVEAFNKFQKKIPNWQLVIVGEVIEELYWKKIKNYIKIQKMEDKIKFVDFSEGFDYYKWHYFAKIFIIPSLDEGLPNRLTESMFFNLPTISYDVGQVHEYVNEKTGFLISQVGNTDVLSKCMVDLAKNPKLLNTLSLNAFEFAKNLDDDVLFDNLFKSVLDI